MTSWRLCCMRCSDGFFFFFQVSQKYRHCFRTRLVFQHCLVTGAITSITCTLDHCHVLKCSEYSAIPLQKNSGLGLHNERMSNYFDLWTNVLGSHSPHPMIMSSLSTTNPLMIFLVMALSPIAILNAVDNGLALTVRLLRFIASPQN